TSRRMLAKEDKSEYGRRHAFGRPSCKALPESLEKSVRTSSGANWLVRLIICRAALEPEPSRELGDSHVVQE
ncbi:MAG TPA: hypothetical protein VNB49_03740, partial [Candidatus Dormibacteraeota bacterium]|nr:hypothetical protein [Candidatus Dormibacteraeota bacterium]